MIKSERALIIKKILDETYPRTPVPLNHKDTYTLLIAVLLSAQCTDERVNQITPALFKLAPNPKKMSQMSVEKIYEIIKPCGLGPQKSKAILQLSKMLIKKYKGKVPNNFSDLEKLPGVGHKTASLFFGEENTVWRELVMELNVKFVNHVIQKEKDLLCTKDHR